MTRNAIFIPANGFKTGTSYYNYYAPYYWTADLDTEVCSNALMVDYINQWSLGRQSRNEGLGIRPVSDGLDESTIEVDPTVLDFGKVAIGASVTKPVTVTNTGTGSLTFYLVGGKPRKFHLDGVKPRRAEREVFELDTAVDTFLHIVGYGIFERVVARLKPVVKF